MRFFRLSKEAVGLGIYWLKNRNDEKFYDKLGLRLRELFEDLGPTFLKLGQVMSVRSDFLPKVICEHLENCLDAASPLPFSALKPTVENALPGSIKETFAELEEEPLASASLSQVHRARLHSGEEVVVKVLRPGVRKLILSDSRVLSVFARLFDRFGPYDTTDFAGLVGFTRSWLLQEVDYRNELKNMQTMREAVEDMEHINIPQTYPELSGKHVLIMEFIDGYSMIELMRRNRFNKMPEFSFSLEDRLVVLMQSLLTMALKKGYFHADMHPANIILTDEGEYYFLDFGLIDYFDPHMREAVLLMFVGLAFSHPDLMYRGILKGVHGKLREDFDGDAFYHELSRAADDYRNAPMKVMSHGTFLVRAVSAAMRHGIVLPWSVSLFVRSAADIDGIVLSLAPDMVVPKYMKDFIAGVYFESKKKEATSIPAMLNTFDKLWSTARKSPDALNALIGGLADELGTHS